MSDEEFSASLEPPDDDENGHAGEDLDLDTAMVESLKGRFAVLVRAVKAIRVEMRTDRKRKNWRIFRLELIVFAGGVLFSTLTYALHYYAELQKAGLLPGGRTH